MALASAQVLQQHLDWSVIAPELRRRITAEAWTSAGRIALRDAPRQARGYFSHAWSARRSPRIAGYWLAACLFGLKHAKHPSNERHDKHQPAL
jgi:hypothetical protein